jgi:hypothetical protein
LCKIYTVLGVVLVPGHVGLLSLEGRFGGEELLLLSGGGKSGEGIARCTAAEGGFDRGKI